MYNKTFECRDCKIITKLHAPNQKRCVECFKNFKIQTGTPCIKCGKPRCKSTNGKPKTQFCIKCLPRTTDYLSPFKKGNTYWRLSSSVKKPRPDGSTQKPRIMVGHIYVATKINGKWKLIGEHRTVWEKHRGAIPDGWIIHHMNGDGLDNRIENLEAMPNKKHIRLIPLLEKRIRHLEQLLEIQNEKATES